MTEAQREAASAGTEHFAAILKRLSHSVSDAYVVVPLETFAGLLRNADQARLR
jgi:hypothetical protein